MTGRRGFNLNSTFHIIFKIYKDKKNIEFLGENLQNYKNVPDETNVYEQKPTKINHFNEDEEKEVKEQVERLKIKCREVAEKSKLLKKKNK